MNYSLLSKVKLSSNFRFCARALSALCVIFFCITCHQPLFNILRNKLCLHLHELVNVCDFSPKVVFVRQTIESVLSLGCPKMFFQCVKFVSDIAESLKLAMIDWHLKCELEKLHVALFYFLLQLVARISS